MLPRIPILPTLITLSLCSCLEGNPPTTATDSTATSESSPTTDTGSGTTGTASSGGGSSGSGTTGSPQPWPNEGMLACDQPPCTFLFAVQTLDDRIEIFAPDTAEPYRGTLHLDLKPNLDGDNGDGRLDEPFEVAIAGGYLLTAVGHYPAREIGSLLAIPLQLLADEMPGVSVPTDNIFSAGAFVGDVVYRPLGGLEPIYVSLRGERLIIAEFNNDLFSAEDTWTAPSELLVVDVTDPGAEPGRVSLGDIMGEMAGSCAGAGQIISLGGDRMAVACDGNEAVAIVNVAGVGSGTPAQGAAAVTPEALCDLPSTSGVRVRHLTPAAGGGLVVAESPIIASTDPARLWTLSGSCEFGSFGSVVDGGAGGLTQVRNIPGHNAYLVGGTVGRRGVFAVVDSGSALETCDPIGAVAPQFTGSDGGDLEPLALIVTKDGSRIGMGLGPFSPSSATAGYGKVLWGELTTDGGCATEIQNLVDLTDGAVGHAPAVEAVDPATWRRAPSVLMVHEVTE